MDSNSNFWFYTLSAISQTLAAIIALSAAFIVHRIEHVNNYIERHYKLARWFLMLINPNKYSKTTETIDAVESFQNEVKALEQNRGMFYQIKKEIPKFVEMFHENPDYVSSDEKIEEFLKERAKNFKENFDNKRKIYRFLSIDIFLISVSIIISLLFLPLYPIINSLCVKIILLAFALILAVFSIFYTARKIWEVSRF